MSKESEWLNKYWFQWVKKIDVYVLNRLIIYIENKECLEHSPDMVIHKDGCISGFYKKPEKKVILELQKIIEQEK